MNVQLTGTDDNRLGKYDAEGHRVQPKEDINGAPFNPDSQGYTQFYFSRSDVPYFLQVPIMKSPDTITVEFPAAAPVITPPFPSPAEPKSKKVE